MISSEYCFYFLRIAIGNANSLPFSPTAADWYVFYIFCKKQALIGVGFTAVEKLHKRGVKCPTNLKLKWYAISVQIEKRNAILNKQCRELTERYEHDGIRCCILKGQGNLMNYPEYLKLRRNPGDIDVWCVSPKEGLPIAVQMSDGSVEYETYYGINAIIEYTKMLHRQDGNKQHYRAIYHHIEAPSMNGTEIENHYRPSLCRSPLRNMRMRKWFHQQAKSCMENKNSLGFAVPIPSVNIVYQMSHLFFHYFDEGVGLRQLMDYYFTLKAWSEECGVMSCEEVMKVLRSFGMGKFAAAVMWVLHEVFAMPAHYYICEPDEKKGRKLLAEVMQGGNFGQYDERGKEMKNGGTVSHAIWKLKRVMRLVGSYPEEALCEPFFRVWHWGWRMKNR